MSDPTDELIALSRDLGREERRLAMLGEGNTSARVSGETFVIKASGSSLSTLARGDVTECRFAPLLEMLDRPDASDADVAAALMASRVSPDAKRPSTEAFLPRIPALAARHRLGRPHASSRGERHLVFAACG